MEIKYLQNLYIDSKAKYTNFLRENVLDSATLKERFSPEYVYKGHKPNTYLVKSLKTNKPVPIHVKPIHSHTIDRQKEICTDTYQYNFYDKSNNELGYKYFYIQTALSDPRLKEMIVGYMEMIANDSYKGLGVLSDAIQIKAAIDNNIKSIPRCSRGPATLYHTKMGFLPVTDDLLEVKSEFDVNRYSKGIMKSSPDLKEKNFVPIIIKRLGRYYIDVSKSNAVSNVAEIKDRLSEGDSISDLNFLELDSIPLSLSGKELNYWKNLIYPQA